jgi:hypothetical protein
MNCHSGRIEVPPQSGPSDSIDQQVDSPEWAVVPNKKEYYNGFKTRRHKVAR